jgi:putative phosphoesterase
MLVGVLTDTHDNVPKFRAAIESFRSRGVEHVIHAGDYVALFAVRLLVESGIPFTGVFGNNDGEREGISTLTGDIHPSPHVFELGGRRIVVVHDPNKLPAAARNGADAIIFGHTHVVLVDKGPPLRLNPGECCGWVTGKCTAALLDLASLEVSLLEV